MAVRDDPVREQILEAAGTPLRVAIRPGTGAGPPLLLCNGIGMRLEALRPFVDALDPAIEVIRFDAPGVGGSQLPNLPYRFTTLALLLREMLLHLGHQQADVLGISWGGGLAQQFALLNPRLCRRLILVATATGPQTMVPPNPLPPVKNLILRRWGDLWGGSAKTDPDALARALHKARISPLSIGYLYQHTAALGFTTLPLLPLIRQRTLVLTGDDDPIIPVANGRILAAGIPHATLHVYHGGHVELVTRPGLLAPLITSFLAAPPHDARRAEQLQIGRLPEDQGPRQAADGTPPPRPPRPPPRQTRSPRRCRPPAPPSRPPRSPSPRPTPRSATPASGPRPPRPPPARRPRPPSRPRPRNRASGPLFRASINGRGGPLSCHAAQNRWKKYCAAAGAGIGIHQLPPRPRHRADQQRHVHRGRAPPPRSRLRQNCWPARSPTPRSALHAALR